ncbi:conserved hypothetical protein [Culex quinquefasciatus]|uniref:Uncharacterized protein n=1 Tax=Culex quinquefasciatus TaxID=7176 RepID=B0WLU9_CULQU|nr:conserved hypothetical protein [Culex quinquefasciatus]|eukprot:XP_001849682.1 conserved hypothetical protein [Culex quinquefasciatus]
MSMASSIEQYRKGAAFGDWADRLEYTFKANKVEDWNIRNKLFILESFSFVD